MPVSILSNSTFTAFFILYISISLLSIRYPPEPNVLPRIIQGEEYMVFDSVRAVVAETRGLKKKDTTGELRIGETQIGITTVL